MHWRAISSAYGRTPFFEYYADDLLPAFSGKIESLMELDDMIDRFCRCVLGIPMPGEFPAETATRELPAIIDTPYYQIWADRYGFIPDLSVLDLIFNMGPEAPLILQRMVKK